MIPELITEKLINKESLDLSSNDLAGSRDISDLDTDTSNIGLSGEREKYTKMFGTSSLRKFFLEKMVLRIKEVREHKVTNEVYKKLAYLGSVFLDRKI
jgi:hypothetical protein